MRYLLLQEMETPYFEQYKLFIETKTRHCQKVENKTATIKPAIVHEGTPRDEPIPGFVSLSAALEEVPVAVLSPSLVAWALPLPVTTAFAEVTVTVCIKGLVVLPNALVVSPILQVKVLPLTGLVMAPAMLDAVLVPLVGMLVGLQNLLNLSLIHI